MKKYIILPLAALALGFTACEDDDDTLGIPVVNPEIPAVDPSIVSVAPSADMPAVISLEQYNNDDQNFPVATVTAGEEWPAGYTFGAVAQISTDENFSNAVELPVVANGSTFLLNPEEVQGYIYGLTRDPSEITLWVRYGVQAVNGKEVIRLGDADSFIGTQQIKVLPFSPLAVIEPVYYLIWSDDAETWSKANAAAFTKGEGSQYDNPKFTLIHNFETTGLYWKIIPESTYDSFDLENGLVIGVTEADSESRNGKLDESADQLAGYLDISGRVMFEVKIDRITAIEGNAEEKKNAMTFSYKSANDNFWLAGDNVNGLSWSFAAEPTMWTNNYVDYAGIAVLGKEFKFSPQAGWDGDFGSTNDKTQPVFETVDGQYIGKGMADGGDNIKVGEPGLYYISLNYLSKNLQLVKLTGWGIIGGFNGWGSSVEMTKVDDFTYTVTQDMTEGDEWKFRANDQWTVSLGGQFDNLDPFNAPNFKCDATGTYEITLNRRNLPWTATVVKK